MVNSGISKRMGFMLLFICLAVAVSECGSRSSADSEVLESSANTEQSEPDAPKLPEGEGSFVGVARETRVQDVMDNPVFGEYGRLIFPVDRTISSELTLENVGDILTWYTYINQDKTQVQRTDAEIEVFDGPPHGFGLGKGTVAEGWLGNAAAFWER